MPAACENTCPKVKQKAGSRADPGSFASRPEDLNGSSKSVGKSVSNSRRSPLQSQKSVHIGEVTSVEIADFQSSDNTNLVKNSHTNPESTKGSIKSSAHSVQREERNEAAPRSQRQTDSKSSTRSIPRKESPLRSSNHSRMSSRGGNSSRSRTRADWDPNGHDPCPPSCPMTQARERAMRKAELRQERLDEYLLNKGFSYFDDLCTCSSICLFNQLRRDRFVMALLKSTCLFGIGMKLCEELDAYNIIG